MRFWVGNKAIHHSSWLHASWIMQWAVLILLPVVFRKGPTQLGGCLWCHPVLTTTAPSLLLVDQISVFCEASICLGFLPLPFKTWGYANRGAYRQRGERVSEDIEKLSKATMMYVMWQMPISSVGCWDDVYTQRSSQRPSLTFIRQVDC